MDQDIMRDIVITPEQTEHVREMLLRHRQRYTPKRIHRGFALTDEYIIYYIKKYIDDRGIKTSKYSNFLINNNEYNALSYKLYKPKKSYDMSDRLKNEVSTGYVSFA